MDTNLADRDFLGGNGDPVHKGYELPVLFIECQMIRMLTGNEQINQAPTEVLRVVSPLHLNIPFGLLPISHLLFPLPLYLHLRSPRVLQQNSWSFSDLFQPWGVAHRISWHKMEPAICSKCGCFFPDNNNCQTAIYRDVQWLWVKMVTDTLQNSRKKFNQQILYIFYYSSIYDLFLPSNSSCSEQCQLNSQKPDISEMWPLSSWRNFWHAGI